MLQQFGRVGGGLFLVICACLVCVQFLGRIHHAPLLAYSMGGDLYVYDFGVDVTLQLTFDGERYSDQMPAWSPDGRAVAFTRQLGSPYRVEDPDTDIYWMTLDGSRRARLTVSDANDTVPAWSPDGTHIVYLSTTESGHEIRLMSPDQTEAQAQTLSISLPDHLHTTFKWTPDGTRLLFHTLDNQRVLPSAYDLATGEITRLSPREGYYPASSPSGNIIAALMPTRGGHALALLTPDPLPRLLTGSLSPRIGVVWADESHLVYLSEDRLALLRVNVQTGHITELYRFFDYVLSFAFQP